MNKFHLITFKMSIEIAHYEIEKVFFSRNGRLQIKSTFKVPNHVREQIRQAITSL